MKIQYLKESFFDDDEELTTDDVIQRDSTDALATSIRENIYEYYKDITDVPLRCQNRAGESVFIAMPKFIFVENSHDPMGFNIKFSCDDSKSTLQNSIIISNKGNKVDIVILCERVNYTGSGYALSKGVNSNIRVTMGDQYNAPKAKSITEYNYQVNHLFANEFNPKRLEKKLANDYNLDFHVSYKLLPLKEFKILCEDPTGKNVDELLTSGERIKSLENFSKYLNLLNVDESTFGDKSNILEVVVTSPDDMYQALLTKIKNMFKRKITSVAMSYTTPESLEKLYKSSKVGYGFFSELMDQSKDEQIYISFKRYDYRGRVYSDCVGKDSYDMPNGENFKAACEFLSKIAPEEIENKKELIEQLIKDSEQYENDITDITYHPYASKHKIEFSWI